jgi:hypothetical protein
MTTIDFLKKNSFNFKEQYEWEDEIIKYNYREFEEKMDTNICESIKYTFDLIKVYDNFYDLTIDKLNLEYISTITINIKLKENYIFHYDLLRSIMIGIKISKQFLINRNIYNILFEEYIKNSELDIDTTANCISIPIICEKGYHYNKGNTMYIVIYKNILNDLFNSKDIIDTISITFEGYNHNIYGIKNKIYQSIFNKIESLILTYKRSGIIINKLSILSKILTLTIIDKFEDTDITPEIREEYLNNQVEINQLSFQYKNTIPWVYNMDYVKKIKISRSIVYIIPLFPEYCNISNIYLGYSCMKNICPIKINIGLENDMNEYDVYINFYS